MKDLPWVCHPASERCLTACEIGWLTSWDLHLSLPALVAGSLHLPALAGMPAGRSTWSLSSPIKRAPYVCFGLAHVFFDYFSKQLYLWVCILNINLIPFKFLSCNTGSAAKQQQLKDCARFNWSMRCFWPPLHECFLSLKVSMRGLHKNLLYIICATTEK